MLSGSVARSAWIIAFAVGLLAGPAWASKVVEVRIGNHPTFTRVVFEMDAPAGYRIERRAAEEGASEILVTLEASSTPRSVISHSVMVERVAVQDGRVRAVAHIRLKKSPSRVKELILSNPARIVIDLMLPEKELAAVKAAAARKAKAEAEKKAAAEPPKLAAAPKPEPKPAVAPKAPEPKLSAVPKAAEPKVEPAPTPKPPPPPKRAEAPKPSAVPKAPLPAEVPKRAAPPEPEEPKALAKAEPPKPAPPTRVAPKPAVAKKPAAAPAPKPVPAAGGEIDWMLWGGVAALVVVVLLVIVLFLRRRALPNDLDVTALAEEQGDEGGILDGGFAMGEQAEPKSTGATGEQPAPAPQEPIVPDTSIPEEEQPRSAPEIAAGPGLFDDEAEKEKETMDMETPDTAMERTSSEMPTQMGAGVAGAAGESDIARLVQELERRVAQLETRLDESVDARERLERQVAAQSEELRVQRAAIARTQRALRSLNRGEEEQATEPALREPSS